VRQSERPTVDHLLIEKLQREVGQLRTLVLKLKESGKAGTEGVLQDYQTRHKYQHINIQEMIDRNDWLEDELQREKKEVRGGDGG
jgi:hypothetical protein